ncbi:unnamed protein product [Leptosia nina]|uniref:Uncharacterized protein n=1 Tax=Leptosia nina TaxID=320188 RepID=A0AAV1JY20_9NEOP
MLQELLGGLPIDNSPAIVEEPVPIDNSPAIIEEPVPIDLNPALVEEQENISTDPAIVKPNPFNFKGPLVQVVVNVDSASDDVTVDQINNPEEGALKPDPVIIDDGEIKPDPVVVVDNEPEVDAENINVEAPSLTPEIANLPEDLN